MASASGRYKINIQWATASTSANDVVTKDVLTRDSIYLERGMDIGTANPIPELVPGIAELSLDNSTYRYHPESTASAIAGNVRPGRQVTITASTAAPSTGAVWRGRLAGIEFAGSPETATRLVANGGLAEVSQARVIVSANKGIRTGTAIGLVLDAAGWPSTRRQLDTGASVLPLWLAEDVEASAALQELVNSEGPGASLFEAPNGDIVFHDRHRRFLSTETKESQATFRNGAGARPYYAMGAQYDAGWDGIVNDISIVPRQVAVTPDKVVYQYRGIGGREPILSTGESVTLNIVLSNPTVVRLPTFSSESTDFTVDSWVSDPNFGADIRVSGPAATDMVAAFDVTTGKNFALTLTNNGTAATYYATRRLRGGEYISVDGSERIIASATSSQDEYGKRSLDLGTIWTSLDDAQSIADEIVNDYANPVPRLRLPITNATTSEWTQMMDREINDRITVIDTRVSPTGRDYWINRITAGIEDGGNYLRYTYDLHAAPTTPLLGSTEVLILNSNSQGRLNTDKLGY